MDCEKHAFIIAEIGSNHNQDINRAFELMEVAKEAGADAVKFQSLRLDKLIKHDEITTEDKILFSKIKLEENWYEKLFSYAKKLNIECISAPTYLEAIPLLVKCGAKHMKIASPQTYGYPKLIKEIAKTNIPTIMSTGYCELNEIERAVKLFLKYGKKDNLTLLHCVSEYPTILQHVNLNYMTTLQKIYNINVGYSDHTLGECAVYSAVALGAKVIEKHMTLSRNDDGPDHFFALEPNEFKKMVGGIRQIEAILGTNEKTLTDFEIEFRDSVVMYPYSNKKLKKGDILKEDDIDYYRSKNMGLSPWVIEETVLNRVVKKDIEAGIKIEESFLEQ